MESFEEAWGIICSYCKTKITDVAYNTWISRIEPIELDFDKNKAVILVPNDFHRQTITRCYLSLLNEAFEAVFGQIFVIEMKIPEEISVKEEQQAAANAEITDISYEYTFDTFIVGSSNKFAHAACLAVATNPANAYNPLFLYGNSGLGKTHLLYAIGNEIKKNSPEKTICYIKGDDFTNELIESLRMARMSEFRKKYRQADILLVDDVQFIGGKESTQEEFFHTFNALYDAHKQIVLTSDRPPKEIKIADRLKTRFAFGVIADIQPPNLETRIAILQKKCNAKNYNIGFNVLELIAERITSNIREMEGMLNRIVSYSTLVGGDPNDMNIVNDALRDYADASTDIITIDHIVDNTCDYFRVKKEDLIGKKKNKEIVVPRQICIYLICDILGQSVPLVSIGEYFGGRDHTTIMHARDKISEEIKTNEVVAGRVKDIKDKIFNR